ncbi:MAG: hypothetical protein KAJ19_25435 [Gammaproteobacteria bacterium]|nr:hypothetical protein [Gammaproteobacteria bacterium]
MAEAIKNLKDETERGSFNLRKTTTETEPSLGHVFHEDLKCDCGKSWPEQQEETSICPLLLDRLQLLEDLDATVRQAVAAARRPLQTRIERLGIQLRVSETKLRDSERRFRWHAVSPALHWMFWARR